MKKIPYSNQHRIYTTTEINDVLSLALNDKNLMGNNKGVKYYNIPCAFDIETSSFYRDAHGKTYTYNQYTQLTDINSKKAKLEKCSVMYVWQLGINGYIIIGRTWDEFAAVINTIVCTLELCAKKILIIYVHNLSYEFQFIRKLLEWERVFSLDLRKPIYAITNGGIEFRCSYLLSGYNLVKLGSQLTKYKCAKKVGDLDYTLIRHYATPLTDKEIMYCVSDVRVVMSYVQELIDRYKGITRLPLTKTGFVRKYCRRQCLQKKGVKGNNIRNWQYLNLMNELQINDLDEFKMLQRAFAGGFTHANAEYTDEVITDIDSYDFTSSYPYVMVAEQYPMSRGVKINVKSHQQFDFLISKYCCIFDVEFTDIMSSQTQDNPISSSKCIIKDNVNENNGRVVCAKRIVLTITNVDYSIIKNFYTWGRMRVGNMYCYKKGYLPTEFVTAILDMYEQKTKLKGVEGKEAEYLNSKEMLNSCYGMCVTNPLRDEFTYNGDWDVNNMSNYQKEELLHKYNTSKNRFLFYPWGIFVTAYARRNLFTGIYSAGNDYVYSDTDSIKLRNGDKHKEYFNQYNKLVDAKLKNACDYHHIPYSKYIPLTINGVAKPLGVWDYEGRYTRFKTLGAKRYMVEQENALKVDGKPYRQSLTVSGVNKKCAIPYLVEKYGENGIFEAFTNYLDLPPEATGKNIHTYIDYEQKGTITDYNGVTCNYSEKTGVHLEPTGYSLSLSVLYLNYLRGIKFKE